MARCRGRDARAAARVQVIRFSASVTLMAATMAFAGPGSAKQDPSGTTQPHPLNVSAQRIDDKPISFPTAADRRIIWPSQPKAPASAPNVLLIMTDDQGFGTSTAFGGLIPTPNFDALAHQGLRYNNFNTTGMCSPSRASLLTGRYPHNVEMGSLSDLAAGFDGYTSIMPKSTATIARLLKDNGYGTAMFGKAHITPTWELSAIGPFDRWPTGLGFDYFYGFLQGDTNQWTPTLVESTRYIQPPQGDPDYILDKDLADQTIRWLRQQRAIAPGKPFFVYYAPGSTHAPHHAPADWIARFKGQFDAGWDIVREQIFARQKAMGTIPVDTVLTPRPAELPAWNSLSADERRVAARFMEAYAAQLAFLDAQLGRVLAELDASGQADNTLVMLIQGDNGASGEGGLQGNLFEQTLNNDIPENTAYTLAHIDDIGGPLAGNMYPAGWGWAMNTPFKWFKQNASHFGGVRNGLIVRWPRQIEGQNGIRSQFSHIADIAPTILDAAGIEPPSEVEGVAQKPLDGISMSYTFRDASAPARRKIQYFEILENAAIYHDGWIAATRPAYMPWELFSRSRKTIPFHERIWELYHVATDFSQSRDLARQEPQKLRAMKKLFLEEGGRNNVFPVHGPGIGAAERPDFENRVNYTYTSDAGNIYVNAAPRIAGRSFEIVADVEISAEHAGGVIVAQGGRFSGYSFYLNRGELSFAYNAIPPRLHVVRSERKVTPGRHLVTARFAYDGGGSTAGGTLSLDIDGHEVARGRIPQTLARMWFTEGLDIGKDLLTPVSTDYEAPANFEGKIHKVEINLK